MHEIRKDNSEEKEILRIEFKSEIMFILGFIFFFFLAIFSIIGINSDDGTFKTISIISFIISILLVISYIFLHIKFGKKQNVIITSKKIKGTIYKFINGKSTGILYNFSMRIDQIDEIYSTGSNLHIVFVSGSNNSREKEIILTKLKNIQEVQERLEELMSESKNSTDLQFEIEAKKLDLEKEKIEALKNLKN
ncbi:hypothetical protein [Mesomycoplasma molare]|uniref:DUF304 domain-containing protein n=1 Tax=Mesomycoplasma molare TaxID=171288 RepID=A0ABY5TUF6_9BACT|nr:hypothetical protein [Mesomycoplasma molare]UWD34280.1 hypothetical protein NX772_00395 [Mesomycoplasma molare]